MGKKVSTFGTVTNTHDGIVGSFGLFHKLLEKNGFGIKRVKITYEIVTEKEEDEIMEKHGHAWTENKKAR